MPFQLEAKTGGKDKKWSGYRPESDISCPESDKGGLKVINAFGSFQDVIFWMLHEIVCSCSEIGR